MLTQLDGFRLIPSSRLAEVHLQENTVWADFYEWPEVEEIIRSAGVARGSTCAIRTGARIGGGDLKSNGAAAARN